MMNELTERAVQTQLYHDLYGGSNVLCPNVYLFAWESDFIQVTKSLYITEYEIKMSRSDFKADFRKTIGGYDPQKKHDILASKDVPTCEGWKHKRIDVHRPTRFFFVAPEGMIKPEELPDYAGLMVIKFSGDMPHQRRSKYWWLTTVKKPRRRTNAGKATTKQILQLMRSMMFRYWTMRIHGKESAPEEEQHGDRPTVNGPEQRVEAAP